MKPALMVVDKPSEDISNESMVSYRRTRSQTRRSPDFVKTRSVLDRSGLETNRKPTRSKKSRFRIDFNTKWN